MSMQSSIHFPNPRFEPQAKPVETGLRILGRDFGEDYAEVIVELPDGNKLALFINRPQDAAALAKVFAEAARGLIPAEVQQVLEDTQDLLV